MNQKWLLLKKAKKGNISSQENYIYFIFHSKFSYCPSILNSNSASLDPLNQTKSNLVLPISNLALNFWKSILAFRHKVPQTQKRLPRHSTFFVTTNRFLWNSWGCRAKFPILINSFTYTHAKHVRSNAIIIIHIGLLIWMKTQYWSEREHEKLWKYFFPSNSGLKQLPFYIMLNQNDRTHPSMHHQAK